MDKVGKSSFDVDISILRAISDLKTALSLISPYPESQIAEKPKRSFEYFRMKLSKNKEIPGIPMLIKNASENAQNKAT